MLLVLRIRFVVVFFLSLSFSFLYTSIVFKLFHLATKSYCSAPIYPRPIIINSSLCVFVSSDAVLVILVLGFVALYFLNY